MSRKSIQSLSNKKSSKISYHFGGKKKKKITNKMSSFKKSFIALATAIAIIYASVDIFNEFKDNMKPIKFRKYEKDTISKPLMNEMEQVARLWLDVWEDSQYLAYNAKRIWSWSFSAVVLSMRAQEALTAAASSFPPPGAGGNKYTPPLADDWVDEVHLSRIPGPLVKNAIDKLRKLIEYIDNHCKTMKTWEPIDDIQGDWKNVKEFYSL